MRRGRRCHPYRAVGVVEHYRKRLGLLHHHFLSLDPAPGHPHSSALAPAMGCCVLRLLAHFVIFLHGFKLICEERKKVMRKAVKQAPVVQSVAAPSGGGSRALITVTRQIQEVRQEYDRMQAAKEPLWFSMPEPVDHNPLHFRYRPSLRSIRCRICSHRLCSLLTNSNATNVSSGFR